MKRFKSFLVALAFIFAGVLAFSLASNTKVHAEGTTVTYTVESTSSVSVSGTTPTGSSATYSSTYTSKCQLTAGNSMTLTLSGFEGNKITGISLSMKSNSSKGKGSLSVIAGSTSIASIADSDFNTANWHGAWSTSYVDVSVSLLNNNYEIQKNENIVFTIAASVNSLYCQSFTVTYESTANQTPAEKFKGLDLQEQLAFNYKYSNEFEPTTTIVSGKKYYLGNTVSNVAYVITNTTLEASSDLKQAVEFTITSSSEGYYYIIMNDKYLGSGSGTNVTTNTIASTATTDTTGKYEWSYSSGTGRLVNKSTNRYLCFTDTTYSTVKAYASSNSNLAVTLITTSGEVTFKDAANNEDKVTMRIGYTISKELYDSLEALGTSVNCGVRLNDTTNVECTKVELDENNYRLFVAVNNIPLTSIDTVLTACGYVSVDGTDYYTTDVNEYSVRTLAQKYLTDYATDDAVVSAKYALIYLAYYA